MSVAPEVEESPLDWHIFSVRDFLAVVAGVRQARARDPLRAVEDALRAVEDALLDLVDDA